MNGPIAGLCITGVSQEEVCELKSTALGCVGDNLIASGCICEPGFAGSRPCDLAGKTQNFINLHKELTVLPDFIPFGVANGDQIGPRAIDGTTESISLDVPIVFNFVEHYNVYVSL